MAKEVKTSRKHEDKYRWESMIKCFKGSKESNIAIVEGFG
jgi:hypothetical protein